MNWKVPWLVSAVAVSLPLLVRSGPHASGKDESRTAIVRLADLDLTKPEDLALAQQRIRSVARRLCSALRDERSIADPDNFAACYRSAVTVATDLKPVPMVKSASRGLLGQ